MLLGPSVQLQHRVSLLRSRQPQCCLCLVHSLRAFVCARVIWVRMSGWMKNEQHRHTDTHSLTHTHTHRYKLDEVWVLVWPLAVIQICTAQRRCTIFVWNLDTQRQIPGDILHMHTSSTLETRASRQRNTFARRGPPLKAWMHFSRLPRYR
jgi:hypothetical protein